METYFVVEAIQTSWGECFNVSLLAGGDFVSAVSEGTREAAIGEMEQLIVLAQQAIADLRTAELKPSPELLSRLARANSPDA